jgi:DNA-binding MarR family transcriptional regulator
VASELPRVSVAVSDRIMLHLLENHFQADRFMVEATITRTGIAESCALHPPNVSRTMRALHKQGLVSEHSRAIKGDSRRQKTWQLTEEGHIEASNRHDSLSKTPLLIRDRLGTLLELDAGKAAARLETGLSLIQVLMHAQHEGVLVFGDIRFGPILSRESGKTQPPGRLTLLAGAHATYHTTPPVVRDIHGRDNEQSILHKWRESRIPILVLSGIAGIGKSTLAAHWVNNQLNKEPNLSVCWYPCQAWDRPLGVAVSILHRLGIDENHDPYNLMDTLPMLPGASLDVDSWRRRLLAYLTDGNAIRERYREKPATGSPPPTWLFVIDDIHHLGEEGNDLLGALLQVASQSPIQMLLISRDDLHFYDRRDVHTRKLVQELPVSGLSLDALGEWLEHMDKKNSPSAEEVFDATGGHPLAMEMLELYENQTHKDWLRFLDEEILHPLPSNEKEVLALLSVAERPVLWPKLAQAANWDGPPPKRLLEKGLIIESEEGMWLHDALRERLLREAGEIQEKRKNLLNE